jgi:hypothetical protein
MALIIVASVTMAISTMQSSSKIADSWKQMASNSIAINRTDIAAIPPDHYTGGVLNITVKNTGQTNLTDFAKWDIIVQSQSGSVSYLNYRGSNPLGDNEWTVTGIYINTGNPEVFDPGILDPGEQMIVAIQLNPEISSGEACRITISTPNGINAQTQVIRE